MLCLCSAQCQSLVDKRVLRKRNIANNRRIDGNVSRTRVSPVVSSCAAGLASRLSWRRHTYMSVERGRPWSPLVTRHAATFTHEPPSRTLPSHALPSRTALSFLRAADPYLDDAVVARGGHGVAIWRHRH